MRPSVEVLDEDGSVTHNKMTREISQLSEESGNYMFDFGISLKSTTTRSHKQ